MGSLKEICSGLPLDLLPERAGPRDTGVPHAPVRSPNLTPEEQMVSPH